MAAYGSSDTFAYHGSSQRSGTTDVTTEGTTDVTTEGLSASRITSSTHILHNIHTGFLLHFWFFLLSRFFLLFSWFEILRYQQDTYYAFISAPERTWNNITTCIYTTPLKSIESYDFELRKCRNRVDSDDYASSQIGRNEKQSRPSE